MLRIFLYYVDLQLLLRNLMKLSSYYMVCFDFSNWEIYWEHAILHNLQLLVEDHSGASVALYEVSVWTSDPRANASQIGASHSGRKVSNNYYGKMKKSWVYLKRRTLVKNYLVSFLHLQGQCHWRWKESPFDPRKWRYAKGSEHTSGK